MNNETTAIASTSTSMFVPVGITGVVALTIGFLLGYVWFMYQGPVARFCEIKYLAEEELMAFEKERLAKDKAENKDLFFGKIDQAVTLSSTFAEGMKNNKTRVIYTISPIFNKDVESISKEVYSAVIEQLKPTIGK